MSIKYKKIVCEQNAFLVDSASHLADIVVPKQGWIKTVRSALAMSGTALSKRLGGHRTSAAYLERAEQDGSITLNKLQQAAEEMHCRLVYAIVPKEDYAKKVENIIEKQAAKIAQSIVEQTSVHMMLEAQELNQQERKKEVQRLQKEIMDEMPRNFWEG